MPEYSAIQSSYQQIQSQLAQSVVGQEEVIEQLMIGLLAGGHCLFEGAPGAARALTVANLSKALGLTFARICCTSELRPTDLIGAEWDPEARSGETVAGPLFANVIFLDDAPRLAPDTDAVIRQALLEPDVIVQSRRYPLADPRLILAASYNDGEPPEHPEPRDDRFLMKISIRFPTYSQEYQIAETASNPSTSPVTAVLGPEEIPELRRAVREVEVPPNVIHYSLRLARATRIHQNETPDFIFEWVQRGAGTRASHAMILAAKIRAALHGRAQASSADVDAVALPVLRHRLIPNKNARAHGVTVDRIISRLLYEIPDRADDDEIPPE